jgi:hypothetical protein
MSGVVGNVVGVVEWFVQADFIDNVCFSVVGLAQHFAHAC